jgi:hypothetical protein
VTKIIIVRSHQKLQLSMSLCSTNRSLVWQVWLRSSTNPPRRPVCWTSKSTSVPYRWPKSYLSFINWSHLKLELSVSFYSTYRPLILRSVCWTVSCLAQALGVTKFISMTYIILVTLFVLLKSDLDVQRTGFRMRRNSEQSLPWIRSHFFRSLSLTLMFYRQFSGLCLKPRILATGRKFKNLCVLSLFYFVCAKSYQKFTSHVWNFIV